MKRRLTTLATATAVGAVTLVPTSATAATVGAPTPAMEAAEACTEQSWEMPDRPAEFDVVTQRDLRIEMSDGTVLLADLLTPDAPGPFPTIVTTTPYSKDALGPEQFLPERGYAHLVVDIRGTGASQGQWASFDEREQQDLFEVVEWAGAQEWSTGELGMYGASYLAITQLFAAAQEPAGLEAIFPIVPMADTYRDIVFTGGQTNLAFIPLWMGLVTSVGLTPNGSWASDPAFAAGVTADHLAGAGQFQVPTVSDAVTGGDLAYDGPYWRTRSPIEVVDAIDVPVFMTGGLNDIFQRGEPLLYERMKDNTLVKFLQGPWGHVDGSAGAGLPADGVPSYEELAVAWFDRWILDVDNGAECFPDVTMYHWGSEAYEPVPDWPHPDLAPEEWFLHADGVLSTEPPATDGGADSMPQVYGNGACSRSTSQWLMGAADRTPCQTDNRLTELAELTYTSEPFTEAVLLNGPIAASLSVSTTASEVVVVPRLTAVAPDGRSRELSTGMLAASFRALDEERSRVVDGLNLQPWHPYTADSVLEVTPGEPMVLDVEIFPTAARIPAGWSLRVSVGTADFPHAVSPLPMLAAQQGGVLTLHHDAEHPSSVAIPFVSAPSTPAGSVGSAGPTGEGAAPAPGGGSGGTLPATGGGLAVAGLVSLAVAARLRRA